MTTSHKVAYQLGQHHALAKLGMGTAEDFTKLVEGDETQDVMGLEAAETRDEDKPVHWGGGASLEGGDTGTRQEAMGLPAGAAV